MEPEPKLPEPEPLPVAGTGAARIFYPKPESEREPISFPDLKSTPELCSFFSQWQEFGAGAWQFFLELGLETLGQFAWSWS